MKSDKKSIKINNCRYSNKYKDDTKDIKHFKPNIFQIRDAYSIVGFYYKKSKYT